MRPEVGSFGYAKAHNVFQHELLKTIANDTKIIQQAADIVGVNEEEVVEIIEGIHRDIVASGMPSLVADKFMLRQRILEAIARNARFHDITEQWWVKKL